MSAPRPSNRRVRATGFYWDALISMISSSRSPHSLCSLCEKRLPSIRIPLKRCLIWRRPTTGKAISRMRARHFSPHNAYTRFRPTWPGATATFCCARVNRTRRSAKSAKQSSLSRSALPKRFRALCAFSRMPMSCSIEPCHHPLPCICQFCFHYRMRVTWTTHNSYGIG